MFTGIIEELGSIKSLKTSRGALLLEVEAHKVLEDIAIGDSISLNGVCITVNALKKQSFFCDIMKETLERTNLPLLTVGDKVNLERPLKISSFLSGHLVTGHVDCTGIIVDKIKKEDSIGITVKIPEEFKEFVIPKGSIAIDGISLTVAEVNNKSTFTVYIIPLTKHMTTLGIRKPQEIVNIEVDSIGKYVKNILSAIPRKKTITEAFLKEHGFS
ncbi:MAG: riboflavin synthase [Candidatus Omnitrophota bacterium]